MSISNGKAEIDYTPAFLCSPYAGNIEKHKEYAIELGKYMIRIGYTPYIPHLLLPQMLDEHATLARAKGIELGKAMMKFCGAFYISQTRLTKGMFEELLFAMQLQIPIHIICEIELKCDCCQPDVTTKIMQTMIKRYEDGIFSGSRNDD